MDWQAFIESQPFLAHIPPGLRKVTECRKAVAGEMLFRVGNPVSSLFCVATGEVQLVRHGLRGTKIVLQRSRGGFIAEASLGSKAYHCDGVVSETGMLLCFPLAVFRAALEEDAPFRTVWMGLLAREVRKLRAQCERLSLNGAAERVIHYIESEGLHDAITLNQSRKAWASELGLSHEALYRTLKRLGDQGLLRIDGSRISLVRESNDGALVSSPSVGI
jgi:CRP-like cAMP-binding protein